jgi:hypothetical protein
MYLLKEFNLIAFGLALFLWGFSGWLLAQRFLGLERHEYLLVGLGLGIVIANWGANFIARYIALPLAFWISALFVLVIGIIAAWPIRETLRRNLSFSAGWLGLYLGLALFLALLGRGLGIFDDYQNLPTVSMMAAGDIPPHFALDPNVRFGYHHFRLLFAAQLMRMFQTTPWTALDLARGLTTALTIILGGLWTYRLTRNWIAGTLSAVFLTLAGGTRWLMLFLPGSLVKAISVHVTLLGSAAQNGPDLISLLGGAWKIDGAGPFPIPFAWVSGVHTPLNMALGGMGTTPLLIFLLLLFVSQSKRDWKAGWLVVILLASLALANEVQYSLWYLGFFLALGAWAIINRTFRLAKSVYPWILIAGVAGLLALFQGGLLTEAARGLLPGAVSSSAYFQNSFHFIWPPSVLSAHLGPLAITDPFQLLAAVLEIGPVIFAFPWVVVWGLKALKGERWFEAGFVGLGVVSLLSIFVQYAGNAGITATGRLFAGAIDVSKVYAVPLLWLWAEKRSRAIKGTLLGLAGVSMLSGLVLLGNQINATYKPVASYFVSDLDVRMYAAYWDRLEPGAMVFDPVPSRPPTIFGRFTDSSITWYVPKDSWVDLVKAPDPVNVRAAGFRYMYFDKEYFKEHQDLLGKPCATLVQQMDGAKESHGEMIPDYRRLIDISSCK